MVPIRPAAPWPNGSASASRAMSTSPRSGSRTPPPLPDTDVIEGPDRHGILWTSLRREEGYTFPSFPGVPAARGDAERATVRAAAAVCAGGARQGRAGGRAAGHSSGRRRQRRLALRLGRDPARCRMLPRSRGRRPGPARRQQHRGGEHTKFANIRRARRRSGQDRGRAGVELARLRRRRCSSLLGFEPPATWSDSVNVPGAALRCRCARTSAAACCSGAVGFGSVARVDRAADRLPR